MTTYVPWTFAPPTEALFAEHIARSIPGYTDAHRIALELSDYFARPGGLILDVGTSLGTLAEQLARRHPTTDVVGIDSEAGMIREARARCGSLPNARFSVADITQGVPTPVSYLTALWTLQFLPPAKRAATIAKIYGALEDGGALCVFEKTYMDSGEEQARADGLYAEFKRAHGFTTDEIAAKTASLRGPLWTVTEGAIRDELTTVGFVVQPLYRWMQFVGYLAVKHTW